MTLVRQQYFLYNKYGEDVDSTSKLLQWQRGFYSDRRFFVQASTRSILT